MNIHYDSSLDTKLTHINKLIAEYVEQTLSRQSREVFTTSLHNMIASPVQRRVTEIYQVPTKLDRLKRSINASKFDAAAFKRSINASKLHLALKLKIFGSSTIQTLFLHAKVKQNCGTP